MSSTLSGGNSKDGLSADGGKAPSDPKNKKNSSGSHVAGQRASRKSLTSSGKPLPSAVVTMATSSTSVSASTGPFHQGELMTANGPSTGIQPAVVLGGDTLLEKENYWFFYLFYFLFIFLLVSVFSERL